ncbi:MAG: acyl-CoA/acyl-ACP dehydrogenase [Nitrospiraceae bacterium]|nr:acyl-CoA/acyl-ACP dehydrogenase [Nitrospiraceae bacterium]
MSEQDLQLAATVVSTAERIVAAAVAELAKAGDVDSNQVLAYDLAHIAAGVTAARAVLAYAAKGEVEEALSLAFVADAARDLAARAFGREADFGIGQAELEEMRAFVARYNSPAFVASLAGAAGSPGLSEEMEMVRDTFRRFADEVVRPRADEIHRHNLDVPEEIIGGLSELGGFGLSIPESYGGFASDDDKDYTAMVIATEELSRASLAAAGSLITRPEILARALLKGGTEEQKQEWLPKMASGEVMVAVAVTEPDYGSDVAGLTTSATKVQGGWRLNGVKTWCTFAARAEVLMVLARTDPDRSKAHRGLSLFVIPKPITDGTGFVLEQGEREGTSGRMEGRPIETIGYRGMHSYEISIDNWFVPDSGLMGGEAGLGRGFYLQMEGFENGRIQTAARALGVMQAAYEAAVSYAENRKVFGRPIADYQLTAYKLGRMAYTIQAARQFAYHVADLMAAGQGALEASMVKAYVCRAAEWVTREALQIHGGMGYAEEFPVSRYFVDARVLSIFEGADETLSLKVIARRLLDNAK